MKVKKWRCLYENNFIMKTHLPYDEQKIYQEETGNLLLYHMVSVLRCGYHAR